LVWAKASPWGYWLLRFVWLGDRPWGKQMEEDGMTTAEWREYIRKITPELIKGLVEIAETSGCEKAREDAAKVLTSRGYVRTTKTSGKEINISWRLKK